jgi:hypothetical protein
VASQMTPASRNLRRDLLEYFQPFAAQAAIELHKAGGVAAGMGFPDGHQSALVIGITLYCFGDKNADAPYAV